MKDHENKNLDVFNFHGFIKKGETGTQVYGVCVFCGGISSKQKQPKNTLYINIETKMWDCKICFKNGGYETWLNEINIQNQKTITEAKYIELAANRGLKVQSLKYAGIGFSSLTNKYTIPIYDIDNKLTDLKIYGLGKKIINSPGAHQTLYNSQNVKNLSNVMFICEGEYDTICMIEILKELKKTKFDVVGLPGATSLKLEWIEYFRGKVVYVLLDNDHSRIVNDKKIYGAGSLGMVKIYDMLKDVALELNFIRWNGELKNGYDVRDLYIDNNNNARKTFEYLFKNFDEKPTDYDEITTEKKAKSVKTNVQKPIVYSGAGCPIEEVYEVFNKHLLFRNNDLITVVLAAIIANRLPGCPVWLFIVGQSGSGKSEVLMSSSASNQIESVSSLTPHALISGMDKGGNDPSLVPKLDGRILVIKDFTALMALPVVIQTEVIGTLRDCFDGVCARQFGNGRTVRYSSKFGVIAGVTPIIDQFSETLTSLGERFIRYNISKHATSEGEEKICLKILDSLNDDSKGTMQDELKAVVKTFLDFNFEKSFNMPDECKMKVIHLAQYTAILRGSVIRDKRTGDVIYKAMIESSTRLTEQYYKLLTALHIVTREESYNVKYYSILKDIVISTAPSLNEEIVKYMHKSVTKVFSPVEISKIIGLPVMTTRRILENLTMVKAVDHEKKDIADKDGNKTFYRLTNKISKLIMSTGIYN